MTNVNLTPSEVAERLRTTTGTLSQWRMTGDGPRYIKLNRRVLYPLAEVEAFEAARMAPARSYQYATSRTSG